MNEAVPGEEEEENHITAQRTDQKKQLRRLLKLVSYPPSVRILNTLSNGTKFIAIGVSFMYPKFWRGEESEQQQGFWQSLSVIFGVVSCFEIVSYN